MISEANEMAAQAAYMLYCAEHDPSLPEWERYYPKHIWRDLVQTFHANPASHMAVANPMEQCVSDVLRTQAVLNTLSEPVTPTPEPDAEPVKPKATKSKK